MKNKNLKVDGALLRMFNDDKGQYINLSDIIKHHEQPRNTLSNYFRGGAVLDFHYAWETMHNPKFNVLGFENIRIKAGGNNFTLSPKKWIEETDAIGVIQKAGRTGGVYAHADIALHFCYWLNPVFQLYLLKEFQRLKEEEANLMLNQWDLRRELTKASYEIHTDAIREHLTPVLDWHTDREKPLFASEADLLNQAVFGMTAKEFKLFKPDFKGNLRDWATTEQLAVLDGLQHLNAGLIEQGLTQGERFQILYRRARRSVEVLEGSKAFQRLKKGDKK